MSRFSPKIEIINYFDNLINRIDIDIDDCLEKFNDEDLDRLLINSENNRRNFWDNYADFNVFFHTSNTSKHQSLDLWKGSTKIVDYLKQIRMKTIEELGKAQEDTLEYYKLKSFRFKSQLSDEKNKDEYRSELFAERFYFQVQFRTPKKICWAFNLFTFVTDFYMSPSNIDLLE